MKAFLKEQFNSIGASFGSALQTKNKLNKRVKDHSRARKSL